MNDLSMVLIVPAALNPTGVQIRMAGTWEVPLWCLADVCEVLGYKDVADATRDWMARLGKQRLVFRADHPENQPRGRPATYDKWYVAETGFYKVVLNSGMPLADPFSEWVCGEVLPSIRIHGCYPPPAAVVPAHPPEPMETVLRFASMAERILSLGGLESRDEILLKDFVRSRLSLSAAGAAAATQFITIPERCVALGYPRPRRGEDSQIGKCVASVYRSRHGGADPQQHQQFVDGRTVMVNSYVHPTDLAIVDEGIHRWHELHQSDGKPDRNSLDGVNMGRVLPRA